MRITIGKFDENGEVVWYDVGSNDYKDSETIEEKEGSVRRDGLSQQSDTNRSRGGSAKSDA